MSTTEQTIEVVLVDDHPVVIQGLKMLVSQQPDMEVAGCFGEAKELLAFLKVQEIDIVLLDITLPDMSGIELCKVIKEKHADMKVLILSNHAERSIIMQTIGNGANGYLLKNASPEELIRCIHMAMNDELAFSREVAEIVSRPGKNELKGIPQLTKREKQILKMLAEGKTSIVIAEELFLSPLTVDTHRRNLMQKFEVKNVAELIMAATRHQLL